MSEDTIENQPNSTLLNVVQSYFEKILGPTPANQTILELEQKVLSEGVELLATARKANDQPAIGYLSSLLKTHLDKGHDYSNAYQSALTALNPPPETPEQGLDIEQPKPEKISRTSYPEIAKEEVADIADKFKNNPKDLYTERELFAILMHHDKLPQYNAFRNVIKSRKIINNVRNGHKPVYIRASIENFLDVIKEYTFFIWKLQNSISSELGILNWQVIKLLDHESLRPYVTTLNSLFDVESKEIYWVYKISAYDTILGIMKKLVKEGYIANPKDVLSGNTPPKPVESPKTKKPRKLKVSNGNGVLLDWAGIEKHFELEAGTIVGTDLQDRIEDILGSPEVPKDGSPGYPESLLEKKRNVILKLLNV